MVVFEYESTAHIMYFVQNIFYIGTSFKEIKLIADFLNLVKL